MTKMQDFIDFAKTQSTDPNEILKIAVAQAIREGGRESNPHKTALQTEAYKYLEGYQDHVIVMHSPELGFGKIYGRYTKDKADCLALVVDERKGYSPYVVKIEKSDNAIYDDLYIYFDRNGVLHATESAPLNSYSPKYITPIKFKADSSK